MKFFSNQYLLLFANIFLCSLSWGKTFLITSANSELSRAIASNLASSGDSLILAARNLDILQDFASNLQMKHTGRISTLNLDFGSPQVIKEMVISIKDTLAGEKLDGIVVIGARPKFSTSGIPDGSEWERNFQENFIGPLQLIRALIPQLQIQSSIVILSGITSKFYNPSYPNTNVLRAMWPTEAKNLIVQLSSSKTRVNVVSPSVILTQFNKNQMQLRATKSDRTLENQLQEEVSTIPLKRHGKPEDVAQLVKFLLSEDSSFINGENIGLDGGINPTY